MDGESSDGDGGRHAQRRVREDGTTVDAEAPVARGRSTPGNCTPRTSAFEQVPAADDTNGPP